MDFRVKRASAYTEVEQENQGITGIPADWPIEAYPYQEGDVVDNGFEVMSDTALDLLKTNNQASYDAWLAAKRPIIHTGGPVNKDEARMVEVQLRRSVPGGDSTTFITPDFSDRTTWYQKAEKITDEILTGDGTVFTASKQHWINIDSPKLTYDHKRLWLRDGTAGDEQDYRVVVKVDDVVVTSGYTVDFTAGTITFGSSQGESVIKATFYHNDGVENCSEWILTPPSDTVIRIEHVEIQLSKNASINKPIYLEVWAGGTLSDYSNFSDELYSAGYGQQRSLYRNMKDLINWCNNMYPTIPACGELTQDILSFPFRFLVAIDIDPRYGMVLRLGLKDDVPITAEISTATIYSETLPVSAVRALL